MSTHDRVFRYRCASEQSYVDMMLSTYPPFVALRRRLSDDDARDLEDRLLDLAERWNETDDGSLELPLTYHVAVIDVGAA